MCEDDVEQCMCPEVEVMECDPFQTLETPNVTTCDSDVRGNWQLTKLELGRMELHVTQSGKEVGLCDTMMSTSAELPQVTMSLEDDGVATYLSEALPLRLSWSDSCVTSKATELRCGSSAFTGLENCQVSCDICECDNELEATDIENASWVVSEGKLRIALWGRYVDYDYCVQGDELAIAEPGFYAVFERAPS